LLWTGYGAMCNANSPGVGLLRGDEILLLSTHSFEARNRIILIVNWDFF
jgi:hypothetical protein